MLALTVGSGSTVTDTYGYLGQSGTVFAIVGATTRLSAISGDGSRVAEKDGSTTAYLIPDLHGNVAATEASGGATVVNAIRYDGYGQTEATYTGTGSVTLDFKYQGRLDVSSTADPLYDAGARFYAPNLGTFTQLDTFMGGAQDPASMNRFLYAESNPTTLVDPDGHCSAGADFCYTAGYGMVQQDDRGSTQTAVKKAVAAKAARPTPHVDNKTKDDDSRPVSTVHMPTGGGFNLGVFGDVLGGVGAVAGGVGTAAWDFGSSAAAGAIDLTGCATPVHIYGCSPATLASNLVTDWDGTTSAIAHQAAGGIGSLHDDLTSGDPYRIGHSVASVFLFVGSVGAAGATKAGTVSELAGAGEAESGGSAAARGLADACANSFSAATLVATPLGTKTISSIAVGDEVTAQDPATGETREYAVAATFVNEDPVSGTVTIDGDAIDTTPHHRFLTVEDGWVEAKDLVPGEHIRSITGGSGIVGSIRWDGGTATMYDLTVDIVHTFAVGERGWVVHNCGWSSFDRAKTGLGPAGDGNVYDHVVEQSQIWKSGFDPQIIHSAANLKPVPTWVNNAKAALYNRYNESVTGMPNVRIRDWLAGQSFEKQYEFGMQALRELTDGP